MNKIFKLAILIIVVNITTNPLIKAREEDILNPELCKILQKDDLESFVLKVKKSEYNYCFLIASMLNAQKIVKFLIKEKTNINYQHNENKKTASMLAAQKGSGKTLKILIEAGINLNLEDRNGNTALNYGLPFPEIVEMLVKGGINIHRQNKQNNNEFLVKAIIDNFPLSLAILLEAGAKTPNEDIILLGLKYPEVLEILLKYVTNINYADHNGMTLLMYTSVFNFPKSTLVFLKHGADINAKNLEGLTALDLAIHFRASEVAKILIEASGPFNGPNINLRIK